MVDISQTDARMIAERVVQLGRIACGDGSGCGLTAAQWMALRYFARANRFSRTVSAFAEFHATTRGTASQTVKGLIAQGYLVRTPCRRDGRSARLDLTDTARSMLAEDPFDTLVEAIEALPDDLRIVVDTAVERLLDRAVRARARPLFGPCHACRHLRDARCGDDPASACICGLLGEPLAETEIHQICVSFAATSDQP